MGLAAAAASETFNAMAFEKVKGSRQAIFIVRNADRFSNFFCNNVLGDITSVISGVASALVILKLMSSFGSSEVLRSVVSVVFFTALVSTVTVGGKAMGKSFTIRYSTTIVLMIGRVFYFMEHRFNIRLFTLKKKQKSSNGKRGNKRAS